MNRELEDRLVIALEGLLEQKTYDLEHQSQTSEMLATGVVNSVLEVSTRQFGPDAALGIGMMLTFQATCGAIEIVNHGVNRVTVVNSTAGTRPTIGTGVSHVEPGMGRTINVDSRIVTLFGTTGELVGIQAFTVGGAGATGSGM